MARDVKLYWWSPQREPKELLREVKNHATSWARLGLKFSNFGDELSAYIVGQLVRRRVTWSPLATADLVAIGSVLDQYTASKARALVWGSGARTERANGEGRPRREDVLAVRGPSTRTLLNLPADTPLGDPGLVVRAIAPRPGIGRGHLVIPHFLTFGSREGRQVLKTLSAASYRIVPPNRSPLEMIREIATSEAVFTSSLHGLVLGHALGKPTTLVRFVRTSEPDTKYTDYASALNANASFITPDKLTDDKKRNHLISAARQELEVISPRVDLLTEGLVSTLESNFG